METLVEAEAKILTEITTTDPKVTAEFLKRYDGQVAQFSKLMAQAMINWRELENMLDQNEKIVYVANIGYCAIMLHIQSMKLLLSGHIVAAGNLSRQVFEAIATALLCSGEKLNVLDRFIAGKYSTQNAVRDAVRRSKALGLRKEALEKLAKAEIAYHKFSHLSIMTIGAATSFSQNALYVGSSFDYGKIKAYDSEVKNRVSLADVFPGFITAVVQNIRQW
jgi:hypothetical protein